MNALTIEARKDSHDTGCRTRFWSIQRDGKEIASLAKSDEAFSKYRVLAGSIYRSGFTNRAAALSFASTL
ncbi:hypothetical protein [Mesorhizobium sp. Root172]|uniref:hypothetical protein n=1 Tax=Mesorhizobium sp. Root172 TaxID=1736481 RepID=UPI0006F6BCD3|nr:hypothetical protein [Mesorhizobium sp. Root172]